MPRLTKINIKYLQGWDFLPIFAKSKGKTINELKLNWIMSTSREIIEKAFNAFLVGTPETVMDMDGTIGIEFSYRVKKNCVIDNLDNIIRKKLDEYNIGKEIEYNGDTYEYKESYLSSDKYIVIRFDMK